MQWMTYAKTTETCNLNCKHCFTNGTHGPKVYWDHTAVIDWYERFIAHMDKDDHLHVEFHGGEPFLAPISSMREVHSSLAHHSHVTWGATTNLVYKLTNQHLDFFTGPLNKRIGTSWDPSIRFKTQTQHRLWRKNLEQLVDAGITVKLFISVTVDVLAIDPADLIQWIAQLGVGEVAFERLTQGGNAALHPDIFPTNAAQDAWFLRLHQATVDAGARQWFDNEFLESVYAKFENGVSSAGTFCRDCEEKIFTINADGTISGCPNTAVTMNYGTIYDPISTVMNNSHRIHAIACERARDPRCYACDVFRYCGGDCHQLAWDGDVCGAPKSLMRELAGFPPIINTSTKSKIIFLRKV